MPGREEVPEEAVEAAAKLRHSRSRLDRKWDELMESERDQYRQFEREYLEAAAPAIRAPIEDEREAYKHEAAQLEATPPEHVCRAIRNQERQRIQEALGQWLEARVAELDARPGDQDDEGLAKLGLLSDLRDFLDTLDPSGEKTGVRCEGEDCHRCGRGNTVWGAPSPLWNAVMRGGSIAGEPKYGDLVCATCFMALAEEAGVASHFKVFAERVNVELETVTPSGRVWNEDRQLWHIVRGATHR